MGVVKTTVDVLSPRTTRRKRPRLESLEVLVDTGATLSVLPETVLDALGVDRIGKVRVKIGDGRLIVREVGNAPLRVEGQLVWARVIFGKSQDPLVLGLTVLEQLGLTVDPTARRLIPTEHLLLRL
ncbi:MAG: retroviral-like aspartic protease family protein [Nitrospinae bacterium]|nr:retroviral-like aspartic protease family protein [Nitrospinota bacterium]